jgi:NAD(P)-dependent dehydrogenase (short-subunit alcohol dehydrogenase family)
MPTILLTGANRGIGKSLCDAYLADGWSVLAACRDPATAPQGATALTLDIGSESSIDTLVASLAGKPLDIVWNNAGIYADKGKSLDENSFADWERSFRINTVGPIRLASLLRRNVADSGRKTMAFTTSIMGSIANNSGGSYLYRTSKTALNMAVDCLSKELAREGIRTVMLHPGWVRTEMGGGSADIDTATSAGGMKKVVDGLSESQSGSFLNYDGKPLPW